METSVFDMYSQYYDLLYKDKDYVAEVNYLAGLFHRHGVVGKDLLEFGAGTGRHGCLLAERGFSVTGIEGSAEMVKQSSRVPGFVCHEGDIRTVNLGRTFDAVIAVFHVLSYQTTNEAVVAVFERAAGHLKGGGVFIFDTWYSPAVFNLKPEVRIKRVANDNIEVTRIAEPISRPNANLVNVNYTIFARDSTTGLVETIRETHSMRHFSIPELEFLAQMSGFSVIHTEEYLTGHEPSADTWGVLFVLRKAN